eukprot:9483298-Lingulodinium_polyedra.AAC.1
MCLPSSRNPTHPLLRLRQRPFVANGPVAQTLQATAVAAGVAPSITTTPWTVIQPPTPLDHVASMRHEMMTTQGGCCLLIPWVRASGDG